MLSIKELSDRILDEYNKAHDKATGEFTSGGRGYVVGPGTIPGWHPAPSKVGSKKVDLSKPIKTKENKVEVKETKSEWSHPSTKKEVEEQSTQNAKLMEAKNQTDFKKMAKEQGFVGMQKYSEIEQHIKSDGAKVTINMDLDTLQKTIKSGEYKNIHDVKKEGNLARGFDTDYYDGRVNVERKMGYKSQDIYYGGISWGEHGGASAYGNTHITLKDSVKNRSIITPYDSFMMDSNNEFKNSVVTWKDVHVARMTSYLDGIKLYNTDMQGKYLKAYKEPNSYSEVHIYGKPKLSDIESVHIPKGTKLDPDVLKTLKSNNVNVVEIGG